MPALLDCARAHASEGEIVARPAGRLRHLHRDAGVLISRTRSHGTGPPGARSSPSTIAVTPRRRTSGAGRWPRLGLLTPAPPGAVNAELCADAEPAINCGPGKNRTSKGGKGPARCHTTTADSRRTDVAAGLSGILWQVLDTEGRPHEVRRRQERRAARPSRRRRRSPAPAATTSSGATGIRRATPPSSATR